MSLPQAVAAERDVVIVDGIVPNDVTLPSSTRVHRLAALTAEPNSVEIQASVLAHADAFIGSHGDLAILAAAYGTSVVSYHGERVPSVQLEQLQAAQASGGDGAL